MTYTPPSSSDFDFSTGGLYSPPQPADFDFGQSFVLSVSASWQAQTEDYSIEASWNSYEGADGYELRLVKNGVTVETIEPTGQVVTFTGLSPDTAFSIELDALDGTAVLESVSEQVVTGAGLPGGVSGIQHTFTTDSLTFTWGAATDADDYRLTLSRDGAEVATQTVTDLTATFSTLEDGTQYDLAIQASNVQGDGPIAYYQASTGYIAPAAPTNLRQFEERIIAVICRWDHPKPAKVFDVEVQLLYGSELVLEDAFDGPETERTIIVPMASTDYLLRVRAGNPGGWSAWAEATVSTEVFPIIDSRLAVMAASYLEDVLHPDTWDGGTDLNADGVGDPQRVQASAGFAFPAAFVLSPNRSEVAATGTGRLDEFYIMPTLTEASFHEAAAAAGSASLDSFYVGEALIIERIEEPLAAEPSGALVQFYVGTQMYITYDDNDAAVSATAGINSFTVTAS